MKQNNTNIRQLFSDMVFSDNERVDLSGLAKWLSEKNNRISSIFEGKWASEGRIGVKFPVGEKEAELVWGLPDLIERAVSRIPENPVGDSIELEDERKSRLEKVIAFLEGHKLNLYVGESLATNIPLWQIQVWDDVNWSSIRDTVMNHPNLCKDARISLVNFTLENYSLERLLPTILLPVVRNEANFVIALSSSSSTHLASFLPITYLVDALNKSGIRKAPIDLILVDANCEKSWETLGKVCGKKQVVAFGDFPLMPAWKNQLELVPLHGVYHPRSYLQPGAHYIVDSTADVATSVSSIIGNVWSAGIQVNHRFRPLVFVQEAKYKELIDLVTSKMAALRVVLDPTIKTADCVTRPAVGIEGVKPFSGPGKVFFGGGGKDLSFPSLVYDVGTSSDLVASPSPGSGHVLVVIPFRNLPELLSLTNNFDPNKQVFIFTSDMAFFKRASLGLKAATILVNSCALPRNLRSDFGSLNMYVLRRKSNSTTTIVPGPTSSSPRQVLAKLAETGGKAAANWRSTRISERLTYVQKLLAALVASKLDVAEEDLMRLEKDIMRMVGHSDSGHPPLNSGSMSFQDKVPLGSVGLVYASPEALDPLTSLLPLLMSLLMGNISLIMSVSSTEGGAETPLEIIYKTCSAVLPPGLVGLCPLKTVQEAIRGATSSGKLNALWAIYPDSNTPLPSLLDYQLEALNRVIIHTQTNSVDKMTLFKLSAYAEYVKLISI